MIDPQVSLAFAIHSNPGAYAMLVGSGVSVGAGIPTGWQVVLDLISSTGPPRKPWGRPGRLVSATLWRRARLQQAPGCSSQVSRGAERTPAKLFRANS